MTILNTSAPEVKPAESWPSWTDAHRWVPTITDESELDFLRAIEAEQQSILDLEYEAPEEDWSDYETFLDSLEPSIEEQERRDAWGGHMMETA